MISAHTSLLTHSSRGFTLIELLVTVAISVILIGGSIAGFLNFRERQQVLNTAKEVQQFLRTAQSKARVRETPEGESCNSNDKRLQGYRVLFSDPNLQMYPLCGEDATPDSSSPQTLTETYTISGVTMSGEPTYINFYTLHRGTNLGIGSLVTLEFSSNGNVYTFTIDPAGVISNVQ